MLGTVILVKIPWMRRSYTLIKLPKGLPSICLYILRPRYSTLVRGASFCSGSSQGQDA